ncbi:hypothetical protein GF382_03510, partial [Candidatus Falkowbacteria bacterium]|nr:hypothetical protein [Candidatus Falkowbacteria bacterium]
DEQFKLIAGYIKRLKDQGIKVIFDAEHFFTAYFSGKRYAQKLLRTALDAGAEWVVLCDTTGEMNTDDVNEIIGELLKAEFRPDELGVHFHDCRGLALSNTQAAFDLGVRHVQGVFGEKIGDNSGNLNLITFIMNLYNKRKEKKQILTKAAMRTLTSLYHAVCTALGKYPDPGAPYVGTSAALVRAGMHAKGASSNTRSYIHFDPSIVGNSLVMGLDSMSGRANIEYWIKRLAVKVQDDVKDTILSYFLAEIARGKVYRNHEADAIAGFETELLLKLGIVKEPFEVSFFRTRTEKNPHQSPISETDLDIRRSSEEVFFRQKGEGEVNASEKVLREVWYRFSSKTDRKKLEAIKFISGGYRLKVISGSKGSDAQVRVFCSFTNGRKTWSACGVSTHSVWASFEALRIGFLYGMKVASRRKK